MGELRIACKAVVEADLQEVEEALTGKRALLSPALSQPPNGNSMRMERPKPVYYDSGIEGIITRQR